MRLKLLSEALSQTDIERQHIYDELNSPDSGAQEIGKSAYKKLDSKSAAKYSSQISKVRNTLELDEDVEITIDIQDKCTIYSDVVISKKMLVKGKLPFSFKKVDGNFICSGLAIESLSGAPQEVVGRFDCSDNKLKTLRGGPRISGDYNCSFNNITELGGVAADISGVFDCSNNKIESLAGGPEHVAFDFVARNNHLKNLDDFVSNVGGDLDLRGNEYLEVNEKPKTVSGNLLTK